jgi:hypothetical protein
MKNVIWAGLAAAAAAMSLSAAASARDSPDHALEKARAETMRDATSAFLATLDDKQREAVMRGLDDNAARTNWSNLPNSMAPRTGLSVKAMTVDQRRAFHAMLIAAMSSQGYLKSAAIMWHEDVLREMFDAMIASASVDEERRAQGREFARNYDAEMFFVHVFGDPASEDWGWMATGHHFAVNFTVAGNRIGFTPIFVGASPQVLGEGRYAGWHLLEHEGQRALELLGSLNEAQLSEALVADEVDGAIFAGPGNADPAPAPSGLSASRLDPLQRRLLDALIEEYLGDASNEAAARQRAAIAADGSEALRFSWWGATNQPRGRYMYRVQGPAILIDYIREPSPGGGHNHVHAIMRDPSNDYGASWLERHYNEAHGG